MERRWAWGGAALMLGLALTFGVERWCASRIVADKESHYRQVANDRIDSEIATLNRTLYALDAMQAFVDSVTDAAPRDFNRLAVTQRRIPGVDSLFLALPLEDQDRSSFEAHWRERYPGFAIRYRNATGQQVLSPAHANYLPIVYGIFPTPAQLSIGLDLSVDKLLASQLAGAGVEGAFFSQPYLGEGSQLTVLTLRWHTYRSTRQLFGITLAPQGIVDSLPELPQLRDNWRDITNRAKPIALYPAEPASSELPMHTMAVREIKLGGRVWQIGESLDPSALSEALERNRLECWIAGSFMSILLMFLGRALAGNRQANEDTQNQEAVLLKAQLTDARIAVASARRDGVRLQTILDTAGEAIVLVDDTGRIELFNVAAERLFGYQASVMQGAEVTQLLTPSYRSRVREALRQSTEGRSVSELGIRELLALKKDGSAFPIELSFNAFMLDAGRYYVTVIRDVTDRKRAERMLFESEYKHRSILDAAHIGIYLLQDGVLRYVNPAFAACFSRSPDEFIDKTRLAELVAPAWSEALIVALDPERSGGRPTEVLMHREDGTRFYALVTAKPIIFDNRPGLAGSLLDITERKAAEEAMLRAEIRNIAILEAIPDLMLQIDASGTVIDCRARSGGAEFGLAPDCVGQHYRRGLPVDFSSPLDETLAEGWPARLRTFEYSLHAEDGQHHFEARVTPASDGEWLVMVRDITERKQIEAELIRHRDHLADLVKERTAELDTLFAASPLPTAFLSQRRFIEVNNAFEMLFGYAKDAIIGQSTRMFIDDDDTFDTLGRNVYAKLREGGLAQVEVSYRAADGRSVLCEAFGKAIDASDPYSASIWVYQDIGERRAAEQALRAAKELAEAASRAKSEFLANMSHELRTPMHAVLSFAELGERKAGSGDLPKLLHYFGRIRSSGQRLLQILNDLLDLSKLEAGKMQYDMRQIDLRALVREVVEEFAPLARANAVQFQLELAPELREVRADALRMGQVIRNLVSNAIKFSPDGGVVRIGLHENDNAWTELRVEDEGVGIPESELGTIFDKFTQSSKTKTGAGGTGLGLAISREIVYAHDGSIHAHNRIEGGACFIVALPCS
jgi:PAS domain S-box-containing protein